VTREHRLYDANFARRIEGAFGDAGRRWLHGLPQVIHRYAERWSLSWPDGDGPNPYPLSQGWVAPVDDAAGQSLVLKLGVPGPEFTSEVVAIEFMGGTGARPKITKLIEQDCDGGAILIERFEPGTNLEALDDERATEILAEAMHGIWRPAPDSIACPSVEDWGRGFERHRERHGGGSGPLPASLFDAAESLYRDLERSMNSRVLLHGDLHHGNVLAAGGERFGVIDPKGLVGEKCYEAGAMMRNPSPKLWDAPDPKGLLARRADQLSEALGLPRDRLLAWSLAQAVLSAIWTVEDHNAVPEPMIECARWLRSLQ